MSRSTVVVGSKLYSVNNFHCCAINLEHLPPTFIDDIPNLIRDHTLLIRSMPDDCINVVINLDDVSGIADDHPEVYKLFRQLAKDYFYVFISIDY